MRRQGASRSSNRSPSRRSSRTPTQNDPSKITYNCSKAHDSRTRAIDTITPPTDDSWGEGSASGDFHRGDCGSGHMITTETTRDGQVITWVSGIIGSTNNGDYIYYG